MRKAAPLTNATLKTLAREGVPKQVMDGKVRDLGIEVTKKGTMVFFMRHKINGVRRYMALGEWTDVFTLAEARKRAESIRTQVNKGEDPKAEQERQRLEGITLRRAMEEYITQRTDPSKNEKPMKPATVRDIRGALKNVDVWLDRPFSEITGSEVRRRHEQIAKRSKARANTTMRWVRAILNYHMTDDDGNLLIPSNPVLALTRKRDWRDIKARKTYIRTEDLPRWFGAVLRLGDVPDRPPGQGRKLPKLKHGEIMRDFFLFVLLTGLRRQEAAGLQWSCVNWEERTVTIDDTKAHRTHVLPLTDYLVEILERRAQKGRGPYVFANRKDERLQNLRYGLKRIKDQTGIEHNVHDLRRTFLTAAESLDLSYYALKRLANHSLKGDVTADYIQTDVARLRKLGRSLRGVGRQTGQGGRGGNEARRLGNTLRGVGRRTGQGGGGTGEDQRTSAPHDGSEGNPNPSPGPLPRVALGWQARDRQALDRRHGTGVEHPGPWGADHSHVHHSHPPAGLSALPEALPTR